MGMEWDPDGDAERRKEGRVRIIAAVAVVLGAGTMLVRCAIEQQRRSDLDRDFESMQRLDHDLQGYHPSPGFNPTGPDPLLLNPPPGTSDELRTTSTTVCKRLLECSGGAPDTVAAQTPSCVANQTAQATDAFSRDLLISANKQVIASCASVDCTKYPDCYMDTLKRMAGEPEGTHAPVTAEQRAKFIKLVCDVARAHQGKVPDLTRKGVDPKIDELQGMITTMGVNDTADLMKEAIASCQ